MITGFQGPPEKRKKKTLCARSRAGLHLTDDKSCIPDVQCYLCVELYRNAWEKGRMMGAGRGGGVTLGDAGWRGGHQHTAAKLMPFFFSLHRLRKAERWLTGREGYRR